MVRVGTYEITVFKGDRSTLKFDVVEGGTNTDQDLTGYTPHLIITTTAGGELADISGSIESGTTNRAVFTLTDASTTTTGMHNSEVKIKNNSTNFVDTIGSGKVTVRATLKEI